MNETDDWQEDDDRATLMTLHASKGLEFPVVFIVALEEGLLPHERSRQSDEMIEEERRLLFVGMTRAREELHLSHATYREFRGQRRRTVPSQFLMELPRGEMNMAAGGSSEPAWVTEDEDLADVDDVLGWEPVDEESVHDEPADEEIVVRQTEAEVPAAAAEATIAAAGDGGRVGVRAGGRNAADRARRVSPRDGRAASRVWARQSGRAERRRPAADGDRGVRLAAGQKKFVLAKSPLRPARSKSTSRAMAVLDHLVECVEHETGLPKDRSIQKRRSIARSAARVGAGTGG